MTTEQPVQQKVPRPLVFISHTHGDRKLAEALEKLVDKAFQGAVETFRSTDPSPTGGVPAGAEPFSTVTEKLKRADAVWVLATPASIGRPWVYWEAGIGSQLCPNGVVVLRVNLSQDEVPSPIGVFLHGFDGLSEETEAGMLSLLGKVANEIAVPMEPDEEGSVRSQGAPR